MSDGSVGCEMSTLDDFGAHILSGVLGYIDGREIGPGHVVLSEARYALLLAALRAKPSWADAPEWARYLAQDEDGVWYWYQDAPIPHESGLWEIQPNTYFEWAVCVTNWRETLEERPHE